MFARIQNPENMKGKFKKSLLYGVYDKQTAPELAQPVN